MIIMIIILRLYVCICIYTVHSSRNSCQAIYIYLFSFTVYFRRAMIRLETLIELKFLDSSFSSSNLSIRAFRAQTSQFELFEFILFLKLDRPAPRRAIRGKSSDSRRQYLCQQYPPPLSLSLSRCIYTYINISFSLSLYIYIYIYTHT